MSDRNLRMFALLFANSCGWCARPRIAIFVTCKLQWMFYEPIKACMVCKPKSKVQSTFLNLSWFPKPEINVLHFWKPPKRSAFWKLPPYPQMPGADVSGSIPEACDQVSSGSTQKCCHKMWEDMSVSFPRTESQRLQHDTFYWNGFFTSAIAIQICQKKNSRNSTPRSNSPRTCCASSSRFRSHMIWQGQFRRQGTKDAMRCNAMLCDARRSVTTKCALLMHEFREPGKRTRTPSRCTWALPSSELLLVELWHWFEAFNMSRRQTRLVDSLPAFMSSFLEGNVKRLKEVQRKTPSFPLVQHGTTNLRVLQMPQALYWCLPRRSVVCPLAYVSCNSRCATKGWGILPTKTRQTRPQTIAWNHCEAGCTSPIQVAGANIQSPSATVWVISVCVCVFWPNIVPFSSSKKPASWQGSKNPVWRTPACVHPTLAQRWRSWHQRIGRPSAPRPGRSASVWKIPSVFNLSQTTPAVLHFSAGEPHLYLAKQTIFCVKNWDSWTTGKLH